MPNAADLLQPTGPVSRALEREGFRFEPRPQQALMAAAVERALDQRGRLLVEAGTGVGKSFAYLVPAMLRCILRGERVVVATNTIALQEQLINKDVPLLKGTIGDWGLGPDGAPPDTRRDQSPAEDPDEPWDDEADGDEPASKGGGWADRLRPVLVKGRGNYLSIRRLRMASQRALTLFPDAAARANLHAIEEWAMTTLEGSLSTAPAEIAPAVWDRVRSDAGNCMGRICPTYRTCFYQNARKTMAGGNLLITNHALFFSDLAIRARSGEEAGFLPRYDHVILDEAHNIEDVASEHFGVSLSEARIAHLLNLLYHPRTGRGFLASTSLSTGDITRTDAAHRAVLNAHEASREFFEGLGEAYRRTARATGGRISPAEAGTLENPLTPAMRSVVLALKAVREMLKPGPDPDTGRPGKGDEDRYELNSYILRAAAVADEAEALVTQKFPGYVYWIEASDSDADDRPSRGRRGGPRVRIACSPVEVAPLLREHLFNKEHSVVLTSATLAVAPSPLQRDGKEGRVAPVTNAPSAGSPDPAFRHIAATLGCDNAETQQLDSPFDYARQVRMVVDMTLPDPRSFRAGSNSRPRSPAPAWPPTGEDPEGHESGGYIGALTSRILHHVRATDGGAFVLFTSFADLYAVADAIAPRLSRLDSPHLLLVQGRGGSRMTLLEEFKKDGRAVLLGAASFWQGVDVRGEALRNVIIVRLPFDPPDRPLTQARLERITARGGNGFMEESLPRAIIRFKQGFGRLVRSQDDRGLVVVLDPRIATARYGRLFLEALPAGVEPTVLDLEG